MKRSLSVLIPCALLVVGCGVAGFGGDELEVIVPPNDEGELPGDLIVSCPSGPAFPISTLEEIPPLAEADPGGVAAAIAPFLESEEGDFWPQEGWRMLHETEDQILLVHQGDEGLSFMTVKDERGQWSWSGASGSGGACPLQYVVPAGLNTVDWRLDPSVDQPGPESTRIVVILNERECVSGQEIGDRLIGPQLMMTESHVFIAFAAQPPPGEAFDCQGNPDTAYVVELPERLGERELVVGMDTGLDLEDYLD